MKPKNIIALFLMLLFSSNAMALIEITGTTCICPGGYGTIDLTVEPDFGMGAEAICPPIFLDK